MYFNAFVFQKKPDTKQQQQQEEEQERRQEQQLLQQQRQRQQQADEMEEENSSPEVRSPIAVVVESKRNNHNKYGSPVFSRDFADNQQRNRGGRGDMSSPVVIRSTPTFSSPPSKASRESPNHRILISPQPTAKYVRPRRKQQHKEKEKEKQPIIEADLLHEIIAEAKMVLDAEMNSPLPSRQTKNSQMDVAIQEPKLNFAKKVSYVRGGDIDTLEVVEALQSGKPNSSSSTATTSTSSSSNLPDTPSGKSSMSSKTDALVKLVTSPASEHSSHHHYHPQHAKKFKSRTPTKPAASPSSSSLSSASSSSSSSSSSLNLLPKLVSPVQSKSVKQDQSSATKTGGKREINSLKAAPIASSSFCPSSHYSSSEVLVLPNGIKSNIYTFDKPEAFPPVDKKNVKEIKLPSRQLTIEFVEQLIAAMKAVGKEPSLLKRVFSINSLTQLLSQMEELLSELDNVVLIETEKHQSLTVVGDLHGQFFDLLRIFAIRGMPSPTNMFLFNGDFVDRGSWGVEIVLTLFCLKLTYPQYVHLLRGNHESHSCCEAYGFKAECVAKYNNNVFQSFVKLFSMLPLAATAVPKGAEPISLRKLSTPKLGSGLGLFVMHGGLFRNSRNEVGSVIDLLREDRMDEDPCGSILEDILWSDPMKKPGIKKNKLRGCGIMFGPDVTQDFLRRHGLSLLIRSHEGPDARIKRRKADILSNMMMSGFSMDHIHDPTDNNNHEAELDGDEEAVENKRDTFTEKSSSSKNVTKERPSLITIFSAPDYPQGESHHNNKAAVVAFSKNTFVPTFHVFPTAGRPNIKPFPQP